MVEALNPTPPTPSPSPRPTVGYTSAFRRYRKVASQPGPLRDIRMRSVGKKLDELGDVDMLEFLIEASDLMEYLSHPPEGTSID